MASLRFTCATDYEQPSYDAASNVTTLRLRDGQSIALTYDNLNRLTAKDLPGTEPDVAYAYDNLGRLTSASQTGHALTFTYDALGRNLTQSGPQGTVASQWDVAGRRTRLTYPDAYFVDYDYLVTGDMTRIRENGATTGVSVLATLAYDDLGRRTSLTRGNGTVTSYGFDPVSRLASLAEVFTGTTTNDQTATFVYNPASQITKAERTNDLYAWTGHGSGTTNSVANGLNQLASIGGAATAHDDNGNVTFDPVTNKTYTYTSENLLKTSTGGTAVTLTYDPAMRLWELAAGTGATRFAYDGLDAIAQYDNLGTLWRRYVHGPGVDEPLVHYEGQGATIRRFLHADERGSIIAMSDDAGAVTAINRYDEYGKPAATNQGGFQYTGQIWLPQLGLYYYKARMYAPHMGRFLQTDPIGYADGMNLYAYVGNDPVNGTDPSGSVIRSPHTAYFGRGAGGLGFVSIGIQTTMMIGGSAFTMVDFGRGNVTINGFPAQMVAASLSAHFEGQMREAVVAAIKDVCKCKFDESIIVPGNKNFLRVTDLSRLPNIFGNSTVPGHSRAVRESDVIASSGNGPFAMHFVVKLYIGEDSLNGGNGIAVTTSFYSLRHFFDGAIFYIESGDFEINPFIASQYCSISDNC